VWGQRHFESADAAAIEDRRCRLLEFVAAEDFEHRAAEGGFDFGELGAKGVVHQRDAALAVHDQDSLLHAREDGAEAEPFIRNLAVELAQVACNAEEVGAGFRKRPRIGLALRDGDIAAGKPPQIPAKHPPAFGDAKNEECGAERDGDGDRQCQPDHSGLPGLGLRR
jgi:hypothetical protein